MGVLLAGILGNNSKNSIPLSHLSRPNYHIFGGVFYQKCARGERCPAYTEGCFPLEDCSSRVKGTHYFTSHSWSSPKELFIVQAVYNSLDPQLIGLCGAAPPRLRQLLLCHSPSANLTPGRRARLPWFTKLSWHPPLFVWQWKACMKWWPLLVQQPEPWKHTNGCLRARGVPLMSYIHQEGVAAQHLAPPQSNQANWLLSSNNIKIQSPSLRQRINLPGSWLHSLAVYFNQIVKIMIKFEFDYVPIKITEEPTQETVSQSLFRQ